MATTPLFSTNFLHGLLVLLLCWNTLAMQLEGERVCLGLLFPQTLHHGREAVMEEPVTQHPQSGSRERWMLVLSYLFSLCTVQGSIHGSVLIKAGLSTLVNLTIEISLEIWPEICLQPDPRACQVGNQYWLSQRSPTSIYNLFYSSFPVHYKLQHVYIINTNSTLLTNI